MKYHFEVTDTLGAIVFASQVPEQGSDSPKQALKRIQAHVNTLPNTKVKLTYLIYGLDVAKCIALSMDGQDFKFVEEKALVDTYSFYINDVKQDKGLSGAQVEQLLAKAEVTTYHSNEWQRVPVKIKPITTDTPAGLTLKGYRRRKKFTGSMRIATSKTIN